MRRQKKLNLPRRIEKEKDVLSEDDLLRLSQAAETTDGWPGEVPRFLVAFIPATGLRREEIRRARVEDSDTGAWEVGIAHPKGEGSWAASDFAPVAPPARQAVIDFLAEREAYLGGAECEALIPLTHRDGTFGCWSDAYLGRLKTRLEAEAGTKFSIRRFRATFAQAAKDRGVSIEAVSKALRHKRTSTTEQYYARLRSERAFAELEAAFQ